MSYILGQYNYIGDDNNNQNKFMTLIKTGDVSKIEKPILFEEEMEKINYYLTQKRCETLIFSFYEDGFIYKIETKIKTIDLSTKTIVFENNLKINLYDLVDVEEIN